MSRLTIKGDKKYYKEIIKLLKSLGGRDKDNIYNIGKNNFNETCLYAIRDFDKVIIGTYPSKDDVTYTYEEFENKYPYKVGDKVRTIYGRTGIINALIWSKRDNCIKYELEADCDSLYYANELVLSEEEKTFPPYMDYDIKSTKEQETIEEPKELLIGFTKDDEGDWILNTHKDYEIKEVDGKFKLIKKQPKYPKTYEECCNVLNLGEDGRLYIKGYNASLIQSLQKLIICRDAYWKIAGEELGLDKPWEPDYLNPTNEMSHFIFCTVTTIEKGQSLYPSNKVIIFPTEEMRDIFYENFKDLIEQCKELL